MGVKFEGKSYAGNMPVFWRGEAKILPGGYKLLQTFPKGTVIPKGRHYILLSEPLLRLYPNMQKSYLAEQPQNRESLKELYFRLMIS